MLEIVNVQGPACIFCLRSEPRQAPFVAGPAKKIVEPFIQQDLGHENYLINHVKPVKDFTYNALDNLWLSSQIFS